MSDDLKGRLTIRLPTKFINLLDYLVEKGIYNNKNEAVRDAIRRLFAYYGLLRVNEENRGE